ncbi:MAG TPA: hypothetical protein VLW75_05680 [Rhizomicrobium sp.]|nr:hypothetical protein [Rhizomicrobium sp.]
MKAWIFCVGAALLLAPASASAERMGITVYGPGTTKCHLWKSDQEVGGGPAYMEKIWVLGFLTAYNNYMVHDRPGLSTEDTPVFFKWIDDYCAENPDETLAVATAKLIEHLKNE